MKQKLLFVATMLLSSMMSTNAFAIEQDSEGYYLIGTKEELLEWSQIENANSTKVKLTADIDDWDTMLFSGSASWAGVFDGQGHTITLNMDGSTSDKALAFIYQYYGGTVKNLTIGGKIKNCTQKNTSVFGVLTWNGGATIDNCVSIADLSSDAEGVNFSSSGFIGNPKYLTIKNSVWAGTINFPKSSYCGGLAGWISNKVTVENTLVIGQIIANNTDGKGVFIGNPINRVSATKCYAVNTINSGSVTGFTNIAPADIASGKLAFIANEAIGSTLFYQNLSGENIDACPMPFNTHKQVYANGEANCDGSAKEGTQITYSNKEGINQDPHTNTNGFCSKCNAVDTEYKKLVDGYYELANANDVVWFAAMVNEAEKFDINGKLTAPIDFKGVTYTPIGKDLSHLFRGTFDGQGNAISNITINSETYTDPLGFLGCVRGDATIKNMYIDNTNTFYGKAATGGIVGAVSQRPTTESVFSMTNCVNQATVGSYDSKASGLIGSGAGQYGILKVENCLNAGSVTATDNQDKCAVAFIGWNNNNTGDGKLSGFYNCVNIGEVTPYCQKNGNNNLFFGGARMMNNCYDLVNAADNAHQGYFSWNTVSPATSGELAAKLGCNFYQDLSKDAYPVPFYAEGRSLFNTITSCGYSSFFAPVATVIPAGVKAYTATMGTSNYLTLVPVAGNYIPANTAVILKGNAGTYEMKITSEEVAAIEGNVLQGSTQTVLPQENMYVLGDEEATVAFYKINPNVSMWNNYVAPGRAYITVDNAQEIKAFVLSETATAIDAVSETKASSVMYNVAGQRVSKAQKGIYIQNGKKYIVK